jgi:hypothetical protein
LAKALKISLDIAQVPELDRDVDVAELQVALDTVGFDTLADNFVSLPAEFGENVFDITAVVPGDCVLSSNSADNLTAIAARRTPADAIGLDDTDVITSLRKKQRRRDARKTGPDDADIRDRVSEQARIAGVIVG